MLSKFIFRDMIILYCNKIQNENIYITTYFKFYKYLYFIIKIKKLKLF